MSLDKLPFNWFDLVIVIVLLVGIQRGRKRGMSEELLPLIKWLAIAFGAALVYEPVGRMIADGSPVFDLLFSYLMAYLGAALVIAILFAGIKRLLGGKLLGSDVFGRNEYYLGMLAGMARYTCMLVAALALLNARFFTPAEVQAENNYQQDVYGSNFFPTLHTLQSQVFERSLAGPWIKQQLGFLLIRPTLPEHKEIKQKEYKLP